MKHALTQSWKASHPNLYDYGILVSGLLIVGFLVYHQNQSNSKPGA